VQSLLQQTPCAQWPLMHEPLSEQDFPMPRYETHLPPLQ
jgi:hypothetical protein